MKTNFFGIDYSMTSPAICGLHQLDTNWNGICRAEFITDKQKYQRTFQGNRINGRAQKLYSCPEQRYENIAEVFIDLLQPHGNSFVALEDYSMGSKGKVFHIAENTGLLKYFLWKNNIEYILVPPTVLKKYATGKGNADKGKMYEAFLAQTGVNLSKIMDQTGKLDSPVTDVVDAYFLARYAQEVYREQNLGRSQGTGS